jgi:hypothetical protein
VETPDTAKQVPTDLRASARPYQPKISPREEQQRRRAFQKMICSRHQISGGGGLFTQQPAFHNFNKYQICQGG